jgi:benzoyl-CoA reductase/2-hydroxyglutaryl-CoA dehydratase subunit BcrC/BadD/HgdB
MLGPIKPLVQPEVAKVVLRRPVGYTLLGELVRFTFPRRNRRAQGMWLEFVTREMKTALRHRKPVVWANAFFPLELLHALDVAPCHPETLSALASRVGLGRHAITCAESEGYSPDSCSFYRCALGLDTEGLLPRPDMVVSTSYLCDGAVKFFHNMSKRYGCDYFLLDIPYRDSPTARSYLAGQMKELALRIAAMSGRKPDPDRLALAMELSNRARDCLVKINELRKMSPCPLSAEDAISYMLDMQFFGPGSRECENFFRAMLEEVEAAAREERVEAPGEKLRLLWLHYIRPYYPNEIFSYLESRGAAVCFGEANHVYWEPMDPAAPYYSLAAKLLSNPSGGPLERRADLAVKLVEDYRIDGVIHFSHWGCRQSCGGEYVIRDILKKRGIPMLVLDGDGTDSRNYSREQTRLRLEAFLEMLEARR